MECKDCTTCNMAAILGHLNCLKSLHENGRSWNELTCSYASISGSLDCLVYAHENGCPWDKLTCSNASMTGNLDCLVYARKNGCPCVEEISSYEQAVLDFESAYEIVKFEKSAFKWKNKRYEKIKDE